MGMQTTWTRRGWSGRWLRALAVAVLVAAWPACDRQTDAPGEAQVLDAPLDFVLKDVDGRDVRLADFKGKPLVINFWATWCGPCKVEFPWFVEFSEKYKDRGLQIVGISTDDDPEQIRAFADQFKVPYPMLVGKDQAALVKAFEAEMVVPVTWIIRPDGTVSNKTVGIKEKEWFEREIEALF
jgi:peroxiredoxin